jgi:hypothetical protein
MVSRLLSSFGMFMVYILKTIFDSRTFFLKFSNFFLLFFSGVWHFDQVLLHGDAAHA